jgi:hypothetical protein
VFLLRDLDTQRVYRLHDFTKALLIRADVAYCVAGKVNSADKLYLVIESVRPDRSPATKRKLLPHVKGKKLSDFPGSPGNESVRPDDCRSDTTNAQSPPERGC